MVKLNSPMTLRARLKGGCLRWGPSRERVKSTMAWANGDILGSESSNKFITNKLWQFRFLHLSTRRFFVESIGNKKMLDIFLQQIFHYGEFQPETGTPDDEVITSSRVSWGSERDGWPHSQKRRCFFLVCKENTKEYYHLYWGILPFIFRNITIYISETFEVGEWLNIHTTRSHDL